MPHQRSSFNYAECSREVGLYILKLTGKTDGSSFNVLIQSERPNKPRTFKRAEGKRVLTKVPEIPLIITDLRILFTE